jgi:hypothetical protein
MKGPSMLDLNLPGTASYTSLRRLEEPCRTTSGLDELVMLYDIDLSAQNCLCALVLAA